MKSRDMIAFSANDLHSITLESYWQYASIEFLCSSCFDGTGVT
jgi:hypothetical protein